MAKSKGGVLTNSRKQIEALALLGRARKLEAVTAILQALGAKDTVVYSAAETALVQFVTPPPGPKKFDEFLLHLFSRPRLIKGIVRERLLEIISRTFPKNQPYDKTFRRQVSVEIADEELAHCLNGAFVAVRQKTAIERMEETMKQEEEEDAEPTPLEKKTQEMAAKRQYMADRRAWIQGGKQGTPPKAPRFE